MLEELSRIYSLSDESYEKYKMNAQAVVTGGKMPADPPTAIIVGGQIGAGKSRLIPVAKRDLQNNVVTVDFDELRILHPNHREVRAKYPESVYQILFNDTERLKGDLQENIIKKRLNVVYEGALRNPTGFCDLAKKFKDNNYNVDLYLMSVPQLESYISTILRYSLDLIDDANPRWIEKSVHDDSYNKVIETIKQLISQNLLTNVKVFKRGVDEPIEIYSSKNKQFETPIHAVEFGRKSEKMRAIKKFPEKFETICQILRSNKPELLDKLTDLKELYNSEAKEFSESAMRGE